MSDAPFDRVVISFSKVKLSWLLVLSLFFVALCTYFIVHPYGSTRHPPLFLEGIGIFGAAFSGSCALGIIVRFFDRLPALVVDRQGFIDRTNYLAIGRVDWVNVRGLRVVKIRMSRLIIVDLYEVRQVSIRGNPVQRFLKSMGRFFYGTPVSLTNIALDCDFDKMSRLLQRYFDMAKDTAAPRLSATPAGV